MKILLITNNLYPELNANSEIVYRLAAELMNKHGHEVTIMGYCDRVHAKKVNPYGVNEHEIKYIGITRSIMSSYDSRLRKMFRLLLHPSSFSYFIRSTVFKKHTMEDEYSRAIRKLFHQQVFDCIICMKNPNETIEGAIASKVKTPIIAYELDPWESDILSPKELRDFQYEIERHCAAIITTNLLYPTYIGWKIPIDRIFKADFPNIVRHSAASSTTYNDGHIHCVFAGQLYEDIRNPEYTIQLFSKLSENFILDIYGNDNGCLKKFSLPKNVIYHGLVDSDTASAYIQAADVVVNIGNTLVNQMPSKILTYISMGKPILNIIKSPECPTLVYTQEYPLVYNLVEKETIEDSTVAQVDAFLENSIGKCVDYSWIENKYRTATPEYVGGMLNNVISNLFSDK